MWGFLPEEAVFKWCAHALHNSTGRCHKVFENGLCVDGGSESALKR